MAFVDDWFKLLGAYFDLEKQFEELIRIIPLDNPKETYSPRLYDILQTSCSQVENLMRILCKRLGLNPKGDNFRDYYDELNTRKILEKQAVAVLRGPNEYKPFVNLTDNTNPVWWKAYNDTKHHLPEGYKAGNLQNTIMALGAVYCLHCFAHYVDENGNDVLENNHWDYIDGITTGQRQQDMIVSGLENDERPRSKVFYSIAYFDVGLNRGF